MRHSGNLTHFVSDISIVSHAHADVSYPMPLREKKSEGIKIMVTLTELAAIDHYAEAGQHWSRAEAVRRLIQRGYAAFLLDQEQGTRRHPQEQHVVEPRQREGADANSGHDDGEVSKALSLGQQDNDGQEARAGQDIEQAADNAPKRVEGQEGGVAHGEDDGAGNTPA